MEKSALHQIKECKIYFKIRVMIILNSKVLIIIVVILELLKLIYNCLIIRNKLKLRTI